MNDVRRYKDWHLETAMGLNQGLAIINKFGRAPSGVQTTATDIWDRADATPTQQLWVAPTQARLHDIASTSINDAEGGTGAAYVKIYGLTSWDTAEVSETVTLEGTTDVETANAYVIIHRMKVVAPAGSNAGAVGTITATAQIDSTVTAVILPANGQSQMAIYGVPSCCKLLIYNFTASQLRATAGATVAVNCNMLVNEAPDDDIDLFLVKETDATFGAGTSAWDRKYAVPKVIPGPAIVKFQATASAADIDLSVSFDGVVVTT